MIAALLSLALVVPVFGEDPAKLKPREALKAFNDLIGSWTGTGTPNGTAEEKKKGFWQEKITWEWRFKGDDAWLNLAVEDGKHFTGGELRYLADKEVYQLTMTTPAKDKRTFIGTLKDKKLTLDRTDEDKKETQRIIVSLLHDNYYWLYYETKPADQKAFTQVFKIGNKKEGVAFAGDDGKPECVVSGGLGTLKVTHKGQTYYVCCSGCRDAFKDDPERYIKEFEERKAKAKKKD
jgi:hypothetical protein